MTLYQLGEDYLRQAQKLKSVISEYSKRSENMDGVRLYEINSKIICLSEMEREMRLTGQTLMNYYAKKPQSKIYHGSQEIF